jgi:hypothetical protein
MRKVWVLPLLGALFACGGGGLGGTSGAGGSVSGFYSLSVRLNQMDITSPSVSGTPPTITVPEDTISGSISLTYSGTSPNPLRGVIQRAQLCLDGLSCYSLPASGVLSANAAPLNFNLSLNAYKFGLPWIAINPYEDKVLSTNWQAVPLTSPGTARVQADNYFNAVKTVSLLYVPVARNSLTLIGVGDFTKQTTYSGYASAMGMVNVSLPKGVVAANQIKQNSVRLTAGALKCRDDGAGNIVDDAGTPPGTCGGNITYTTGALRFQINGIAGATDVQIDYVVSGSQQCLDDGAGNLAGECTGSVNYTTGQVSYRFNDNFVSTPAAVNINWTQASAAGNTITYALPPPSAVDAYVYQVSGRVVEVYQGTTLLCNNQGTSGACNVSVSGNTVSINFPGGVLPNLSLRYSQDTKVDINPGVDASVYGGQYGGSSTPTVSGYVEVEVRLESGETLRARVNITFRIVPQ